MEPHKTCVTAILDLPPLLEIPYHQYDAADERNNLSDLGGAAGKHPMSLNLNQFSLKQFAWKIG